jgi:hypothetical protein
MSWPIGPDYNDAIQNPQANFRDPCLRRGRVVTTRLGLPAVDSGNFASVFQVLDGSQRWAVKCFTRQIRDQQERYKAISDQLKARPLPFTVSFDYQPEGILVRGSWYPILRMQWIDGPLLDAYVRSNLNNRRALGNLAQKWLACINTLQQSGIAHGDLQFGNIKILGGDIRLIDYDGMFVPALRHMGSSETGHQNFQHPRRTGKDYGPYVDNFPAWVIYTSLLALAEQPSIWQEFDGGDDCLIFRRSDFESPGTSRVFARLERLGSKQLQACVIRLKDYSHRAVHEVPPLQAVRPGSPERTDRPPQRRRGRLPEWISPESIVDKARQPIGFGGPGYPASLRGHELSQSQIFFVMAGILTVVGVGGGLALGVPPSVVMALVATLTTGTVVLIHGQYKKLRHKAGIPQLESELADLDRRIASLTHRRQGLDQRFTTLHGRVNDAEEEIAKHATHVSSVSSEWDEKANSIRHARDLAIEGSARRAADLQSQKQAEFHGRIVTLKSQAATLDLHRDAKLTSSLNELRVRFIEKELREHELRDVRFEGLGETLSTRLKKAGFLTAFDILKGNPRLVDGIGTARAYALETWAVDVRTRAEGAAPKRLPIQMRNEILQDFAQRKRHLEAEIAALERQFANISLIGSETHAAEQRQILQQFSRDVDKLAGERAAWEQAVRIRSHELNVALQRHRSGCLQATQELCTERDRLSREAEALVGRHGECSRELEVFRGFKFKIFLLAVVRLA